MIIIEYGKDIFLEGKKVRVKGEESSIHFSREGVHIAAELCGGGKPKNLHWFSPTSHQSLCSDRLSPTIRKYHKT